MTRKVYKTAQGKLVDLGALQLQNETVRAVGNMGVNARGDLIDSRNTTITSRNQQVAKQYKRQIKGNVSDSPVPASRKATHAEKTDEVMLDTVVPNKIETPAAPVEKPAVVDASDLGSGGLAAAIAKARTIKQEPLPPASSRTGDGPVKI